MSEEVEFSPEQYRQDLEERRKGLTQNRDVIEQARHQLEEVMKQAPQGGPLGETLAMIGEILLHQSETITDLIDNSLRLEMHIVTVAMALKDLQEKAITTG